MASGMTNRGRFRMEEGYFQRQSLPLSFHIALVTNLNVPDDDTNLLSDLDEIAAGNGYIAGGEILTPGTVDFPTATEDDVNDRAVLTIRDIIWTATLGPIPFSGLGASYSVLLDDNAVVGSRDVLAWFDLSGPRSVLEGAPLTVSGMALRLKKL